MKHLLTACLLSTSLLCAKAQQQPLIDSILANRIVKVPYYEIPETGAENLILRMSYAQSTFIDTSGIYALQNAQILSVDLLFSDYPSASDLKPLNKSRLAALCRLVPGIDMQQQVSWNIVRQTDGADKASAEKLVHGFVINYRKKYTAEDATKELDLIEAAIPPPPPPPPPAPKEKVNHWAIIHRSGTYVANTYNGQSIKRKGESRKEVLPFLTPRDTIIAITSKEAQKANLLPPEKSYEKKQPDSIYLLQNRPVPLIAKDDYTWRDSLLLAPRPPADSTILKIFNRNPLTSALVVMDVTSSMSPYMVELLRWVNARATPRSIEYVVCFNDGDKQDDITKQINQTGGIYGEKYTSGRQTATLIRKTMAKGNGGGDMQENPCEALLRGIHEPPFCKDVILIADSWAPMRDTALISNIRKPVHIVICGKRLGIHPDYVKLALVTGGSLHFENEDIPSLEPLKEGKEMEINHCTYYYTRGRVFRKMH